MYPISIITTITNKTYIVDGRRWTEVPNGTTLEDAQKLHRTMFPFDYVPKQKFATPIFKSKFVKSTRKVSVTYEIRTFNNGRVTCNCPGFTFRGKCKHV